MYRILIKIPNDELITLATLEAMRQTVQYFPKQVVMDVVVYSPKIQELVLNSALASKIFENEEDSINYKYDLVFASNPTMENSLEYGTEERDKKLLDMKKYMGAVPEETIPASPYSMFATVSSDLSKALGTLEPSYDVREHVQMVTAKPYIRVMGKAIKSLNNKIRDKSKLPLTPGFTGSLDSYYYAVLFISSNDTEEEKDIIWEMGNSIEIPCIYVNPDGTIWGSDQTLTISEQMALVASPMCATVYGRDWRTYLGWIFNKALTVQCLEKDGESVWNGVRSVKAVSWSIENKPLKEVAQHYKNLVFLNIKDMLPKKMVQEWMNAT